MVEAKVETPAPRKRGRPRTVTEDQEIPEVGDDATNTYLDKCDRRL